MKIAFTIWEGRISPVFDAAQRVLLACTENGVWTRPYEEADLPPEPFAKITCLKEADATGLVCGAISRHAAYLANESGIQVSPFVSGDIELVMQAYLDGKLAQPAYSMPGCRCGNGRGRHGRGGADASSICLACGHRELHRRGYPCNQHLCPKCGHTMARAQGPAK